MIYSRRLSLLLNEAEMVLASASDIGGIKATGYPPAEPAVPSLNALGARQLSAVAYGAKWLADR